jgi:hypothetical protein
VVDSVATYAQNAALLTTVTATTSGNGLSKTTIYQDVSGTTFDTRSDTETYDTNGDGGVLTDYEDVDLVGGTTLRR